MNIGFYVVVVEKTTGSEQFFDGIFARTNQIDFGVAFEHLGHHRFVCVERSVGYRQRASRFFFVVVGKFVKQGFARFFVDFGVDIIFPVVYHKFVAAAFTLRAVVAGGEGGKQNRAQNEG